MMLLRAPSSNDLVVRFLWERDISQLIHQCCYMDRKYHLHFLPAGFFQIDKDHPAILLSTMAWEAPIITQHVSS